MQDAKLRRQDNLESLVYVLVYLLHEGLPWKGLADSNLIAQHKLELSVKDLCDGHPAEYATFLNYLQTLPFDTKPNYNYISRLFSGLVPHEGTHPVFDWDSRVVVVHDHIDNTPYTKPPPSVIALCTCRP